MMNQDEIEWDAKVAKADYEPKYYCAECAFYCALEPEYNGVCLRPAIVDREVVAYERMYDSAACGNFETV